MNSSSITIWYETGCPEEVHLPDPGLFDLGGVEGYYAQREYIDVANPDEGIFLSRYHIPLGADGEGGEPGESGEPWRLLAPRERTRLVAPCELRSALLVVCHGVVVLRREPDAGFACGLAPVAPEALGFEDAARDRDPEWLASSLEATARRLLELGDVGAAALRRAMEAAGGS